MSDAPAPRVPAISPKRRRPAAPFVAPSSGSIEERLAAIAQEINRKADRVTIPAVTAIEMTSEAGTPYLVYVDAQGNLRTVAMTL